MTAAIYVLAGTERVAPKGSIPEGIPTIEWTEAVRRHRRERFYHVNFQNRRDTSRWVSVERKRPWIVVSYYRMHWAEMSSHKSFAAAWKAAQQLAADEGH